MSTDNKPLPITAQEEKDLHRVFELLSDYQQKTKLKQEIKELQAWYNSHRHKTYVDIAQGEKSLRDAQERIDYLQKELQIVENKPDKKISVNDVYETYRWLGHKITKKEVEEVVWEVDEALDGYIDWDEFRLMFNRNITDRTGLEPSRMYNLTQFLIYDTNNNGYASVDETMNLLYARYGRAVMEQKLKELFGEDMHEFGRQGGEIAFPSYLKAVEKVQLNMFLDTSRGRREKDVLPLPTRSKSAGKKST